MLRAMPFPVVNPEVQTEVTNAQWVVSSRINATRAELTKLRLVKQGLMDDLLTGRVRVPVESVPGT
jgi:type I restriction enzyme, S subunit